MGKLIIALMVAIAVVLGAATTGDAGASTATEYLPASLLNHYEDADMIPISEFAVIAGQPIQQCADCKCCNPSNPNDCQVKKCCYGIVCNLPGKPFGECSFMPKVCNCDNCQ